MTDPKELTKEAIEYLDYLIGQLGNCYDELYGQDLELDDLGYAIDAITFAKSKLEDHTVTLESRRKELLRGITSSYSPDEEERQWEKEK